MWVPTQDEAVLLYAHFLKVRHGAAASKLARKKASKLQDDGDHEGHKIWNAVADAVDRPSAWPKPRLLDRGGAAYWSASGCGVDRLVRPAAAPPVPAGMEFLCVNTMSPIPP